MTRASSSLAIAALLWATATLAPAAATDQCAGDRVVWVSEGRIYDASEHAAQIPGRYDCLARALAAGAREPQHHARRATTVPPANDAPAPPPAPPPPAPPPPAPPPEPAGAAAVPHEPHAARPGVVDSVYDDIDRGAHRERHGYGRYTYLLFTDPGDTERNAALLDAVMQSTPLASSVSVDPRRLNVFEIPETNRFWNDATARTDPRKTLSAYDFGAAHDLILKACAAPDRPALCTSDLSGPFMLTYAHPLEALAIANPPYLIVDLHRLNAHGFAHVVGLMKEQVKESDVADGHLVESMSVHLLSAVLDISDWLPNLVTDVKDITGVVGAH